MTNISNQTKAYLSKFDLRYYWLLVAIVFLFAGVGEFNTPDFLTPILCAFVIAGFALKEVDYKWTSFVAIFVLAHVVQYPLAALVVLSQPVQNAVEFEYWNQTPISMWAMVASLSGLILGLKLLKIMRKAAGQRNVHAYTTPWVTPVRFNIVLTLFVVPMAIIYNLFGIYYHNVADSNFNMANAQRLGFVGYLHYISIVGLVLQVKRYSVTNSRKDLYYAIVILLIQFAVLGPSGSRVKALFAIVVFLICLLGWVKQTKTKTLVVFAGGILFFFLLVFMEMYRTYGMLSANVSFFDRSVVLLKSLSLRSGADVESSYSLYAFTILARRLSDYVSVGYLIDVVPSSYPYLGIENMMQYFLYTLPTLIRPQGILSYAWTADIMERYGFRPMYITGGSSPMMLIGELYARGGWLGIVVGMMIIGLVLYRLDKWLSSGSIFTTIIWALFLDSIINLHAQTTLQLFTMLTRQLVIYIVIAHLILYLLKAFKTKDTAGIVMTPQLSRLVTNERT